MLEEKLKKHFEFSDFKSGQKEVIECILNNQDVVALMPTGGGKSLCYQLPAVLNDKITVIISPLIALMKDQVDSLNARGINAEFINSSLTYNQNQEIVNDVKTGKTKIIYIAPERFKNQEFKQLFSELDINLLAVDEAHCVSQWGHDFRPDYMLIKNYVSALKSRPTIAAFTATATPEVTKDIINNLGLINSKTFVRGFDRPNLKFFVQNNMKEKERVLEALRIIKKTPGSGIVYSLTRKSTEQLTGIFNEQGIKAVAYHAGMDKNKRNQVQNDFMENKYKVIVATVAFGMGINKADIRFVIHMGMPQSIENYYQEAGRAGRDGELAYCVLLAAKKDFGLHNFLITQSRKEMQDLNKPYEEIQRIVNIKYRKLEKMKAFVDLHNCRKKMILQYFSDPDADKYKDNCNACDVCLNFKWKKYDSPEAKHEVKKDESGISDTVMETVNFYKKGYSIEKIAKIRELGESTILGHLIKWYVLGGDLNIDELITKSEEKQILQAMSKAKDYQFLSSIKEQLPEEISYEKIRLVIAKIHKIKLI